MRRALPAAAFCAGFLAGDFLAATLPIPLLWHLPAERRFVFAVRPLGLAADLFGRVLFAAACGCVAAALAGACGRLGGGAARPALSARARHPWLDALLAWSLSLLLLGCSFHVWTLSRRRPVPAALPEGHVGR